MEDEYEDEGEPNLATHFVCDLSDWSGDRPEYSSLGDLSGMAPKTCLQSSETPTC
jgi:hypothetical protein